MRFRLLHIALLLLSIAGTANAQQVWISGSVTDTEGKPLPNISVLAYKAGTRIIVTYSATNADGKYGFGISTESDSLDVGVNSLFFEKKRQRIANRTQTVNFVLREEVQQLKGVNVKARPIEQRGDTLEYFVGSFVQKQDNSIEDVLKRMPGIEVEDNGKITYQGLPIQKFYVEGMDLMGGNYAQVSKNLPHQSVASVEVYENHQPIKMLEDRVSSEQASINIKLANDVAVTGSGKVSLGAAPFLWNVSLTPMLFSSKTQLLASYKTNNTGDDLTIYTYQQDYGNMTSDHPAPLGEVLSIKSAQTPLFNAHRYLDNCTHLVNLNALTPVNEKMQVRVNLYYLNDLQKQSVSQKSTMFLANDTISYTETMHNRFRGNRLFGTVTLNRNDKNCYLDDKLNFSRQWDNASGNLSNNGLEISEMLQTPLATVTNDLRLVFPVGKHLLDFTSYIGYGQTPHTLEIEPVQFADLLNDSALYAKAMQSLKSTQFFADHAVSGIFSIKRLTFRPKAGFLFVERNICSQLSLCDSIKTWQSPAVSDAQVTHSNVKPYLTTEIEYKFRRFSASLDLPVYFQQLEVKSENGTGDHLAKLFFNPAISVRLKAGNFWTFNSSVHWNHYAENFDSWLNTYILTDYQSLVLRNAPISVSNSLTSNVGFQFKQPFISLNADLHYGIGRTHSEMMYSYEIDEGGTTRLQAFIMPNNRIHQTVQGNVRKYFSALRTTIGLKGTLLDMRGVTLVNGSLLNSQNVSYSLSPNIMLKATNWMNIDYSLNFNEILSYIDNQSRSQIKYWRHFANIYVFPARNQDLSLTAEYYRHQGQNYFFMDFSYTYIFAKPKLDLELRWNNIFNSRQYVSYYSGSFSVQETIYQLRPMEVTVAVKFRF